MNLKSLVLDTKSAWVDYPGMEGFQVEVVNLSRDRLIKLQKSCMISKINRSTRQPEQEIDSEKFVKVFSSATIKDWKGFKYKYVEELILADISTVDPEAELEFSTENASVLVSGSTLFDTWLNEVVFNLDNFRAGTADGTLAETGEVAK